MYLPTTSSLQSNNKFTEAAKNAKETTFKTSNPQIFPSLNPMGALYKQRKVVHPNPLVHEHSDAPELVKKVKLNSGVEERTTLAQNIHNGFTQQQRVGEVLDKDGFRTPKLPKRLENKGISLAGFKQVQEARQNKQSKAQSQRKANKNEEISKQNMEVLYHGIDPLAYNALFDQLRLEYIAYQLSQQAELYNRIYHNQNQFSLSQSLMKEKINPAVRC